MTEPSEAAMNVEVRKAILSYLFEACQPNRGDVFSWVDDHISEIVTVATRAMVAGEPVAAPDTAALVGALEVLERQATATLEAMDAYNKKHGTFLCVSALFQLGVAIAPARALIAQHKGAEHG